MTRSLLVGGTSAVLVVLELLHPHWSSGTVYQAVAPTVARWIPLHVLLVVLFACLALVLYAELGDRRDMLATLARVALALFVVGNSAFIGIDGIASGLFVQGAQSLSPEQQAGVEQALQSAWGSSINDGFAKWQWLTWMVAVGSTALVLYPRARRPVPLALLGVASVLLIGGGWMGQVPSIGSAWWAPGLLIGSLAAGIVVIETGSSAVAFGLLIVAAGLPQHGGITGGVGVACVGLALMWRMVFDAQAAAGRDRVPVQTAAQSR